MQRTRRIAEILILFGVTFLPGYFAQIDDAQGPVLDSAGYHIQYALFAIPQIALLLFVISGKGNSWKTRYGFSTFTFSTVARGFAVFGILLLAATPILFALSRIVGDTEGMIWRPTDGGVWALAALTVILGALREEVFFRSYLLTEVERLGTKTTYAVVGTALLFGIGHAYQGVSGLVITLVLGGVLGVLYVRRRNIYEVAIGHALYNAAVLVFSFFADA